MGKSNIVDEERFKLIFFHVKGQRKPKEAKGIDLVKIISYIYFNIHQSE